MFGTLFNIGNIVDVLMHELELMIYSCQKKKKKELMIYCQLFLLIG